MTAYTQLPQRLPNDENPIKKVQLVAWGEEAMVHLDEIPEEFEQQTQGTPGQQRSRDDQLLAIYTQVASVNRKHDDFVNDYQQHKAATNRRLDSLNRNLNRIALQPVQRPRHAGGQQSADDMDGGPGLTATLSPCPRNLYVLWSEYQEGIGGRKPARLFTAEERGKVKFKYCRRKYAWDAIDRMVRSGSTAQVAIDRIYTVYGRNKSTTEILQCLRNDAPHGHPNLQ